MKCSQEKSAQLMEYAEGSLPTAQAAELEKHLSGCAYCREELESWRRLEERLRAFPLLGEPADFKHSVMSRVAEMRSAPVPVAYRPVDPVVVGALGAIVLGTAALLAGVGSSWELSFDGGYWVGLSAQALAFVWAIVGGAISLALSNFAQTLYANLLDAIPVLAAALLLALFALGPNELMSAVRAQSRQP